MKNVCIIRKLWYFFGLFVVLLITQMTVVNGLTRELKSELVDNVEVHQPMTRYLHQIQVSVIQTQQWLTDISATRGRDGLDDGFKEAEAAAGIFNEAIQQLIRLDPDRATRYRELLPVYQAYYQTGQRMAHAYIDEGPAGGNKIMAEFDATAAAIYDLVDRHLAEFENLSQQRLEEQKQDSQQLELLNYGFAVAYLLLLALLIYAGVRYVTNPAKRLVSTLSHIASGDLSETIEVTSGDEIGEIAKMTNSIIERLGGVLRDVSSQGLMISAYSQATNMVVGDTAGGVERQKRNAKEILGVIGSMNDSVDQVGLLSQQAREQAEHANDEASRGRQVVERNVQAISSLAGELTRAEESIQALNRSSDNISSVLKVIQEIAEQTNLLALNAAIEAARAGEQGRGFAVVADEVRTLAARTQGSAQEIKEMIEALQQGTREAVALMNLSHEQTRSSVEHSAKAGESLQAIAQSVDQITRMNAQIADAAELQKSVSTSVNSKISEIVASIEDVQSKSNLASRMGEQTRQHATDFSTRVLELKLLRQ